MLRLSLVLTTALIAQTAYAADPLELSLTLKNHVFAPAELKAPANQAIVITVTNEDATPEEFESTSLKIEKVVAAKSTIKLRVKGLSAGRYEFFGEYNEATAKGVLIVE